LRQLAEKKSKEMKIAYKACFAALVLACPLAAEAGISMVIDTVNNQFWFTGSDTGILEEYMADVANYWNYGTQTGTYSTATITDAFTIGGSTALSYSCIDVNDAGGVSLACVASYDTSTTDEVTLVADSTKIYSYGGNFDTNWSATSELNFEALIGTSILSDIASFDSITVVAAAVPEPAYFAGLAGLGALGAVFLRRRRG
jgi:hypothetical protein